MLETEAIVVAVEPGFAWVESERRSACSGCGGDESCGVSAVGKLFGARRNRMRISDPIGVCAGETVVIGLSEQRLVAAAALAYLLPLGLMLITALTSARFGVGQLTTLFFSLAGLGGGLWLVQRRGRRTGADALYSPALLRRAASADLPIQFEPRKRSHP